MWNTGCLRNAAVIPLLHLSVTLSSYLRNNNSHISLSCIGKLYDGGTELEPHYLPFPNDERVVDVQGADQYMIAVTECGNVYSWGKNSASIIQVQHYMCVVCAHYYSACSSTCKYFINSIEILL